MMIRSLSPTSLEQARLCRARLKAKYSTDGSSSEYEEEQGDFAKIGTLAHEAAKVWYRNGYYRDSNGKVQTGTPQIGWTWVTVPDVDSCFKAAIELCHAVKTYEGESNSQVPNNPQMIGEARTMFEEISAYYPRENAKVVFVERKYKGKLPNGVDVSLIIDLGLDVGNGTLEVIDFKTGFITISDDEMYDKDQVLLNLLALSYDKEFTVFHTKQFRYFWVRDGYQSRPVIIDQTNFNRLTDYELWLQIEWQSILDDNDPKESINRFCYSCGRRRECKAYAKYLGEAYGGLEVPTKEDLLVLVEAVARQVSLPVIQPDGSTTTEQLAPFGERLAQKLMEQYGMVKEWTVESANALTLDDLMGRFDRIKTQSKVLERGEAALEEVLEKAMSTTNAKELEGLKHKAAKVTRTMSAMDPETVMAMCTQYGIRATKVVSIIGKSVEEEFSQYPEAINHLRTSAKKFPTKPWIKVSGLTPKKRAARKAKQLAADKTVPHQASDPAPQDI